ncbi:head completion/stabilization protein [Orbus wheelerorum]|uniref:head completion/stabilization protein n=1 Tax=Orbus wheelerorum TaxID=3074111 RepID=UPI00370D5BA6
MFSGQELKQDNQIIKNDGFWPDLNLADFQRERSMSPNLNVALLSQALVSAMIEINITLENYQITQKAKGINLAQEIGVISFDGLSSTVIIYNKAVFARAKADLIGEFVSISNREDKIGESQLQMAKSLIAESSREVRKILGLKRTSVVLI